MPREAPQMKASSSEPPPPRVKVKQSPIDAMCAFCETVLGSDVFAEHTCKCMQCGDPVAAWRLREDAPPLCDPCMLGIGDAGDEDDLDLLVQDDHMVRG
jgi:hypothetical protein